MKKVVSLLLIAACMLSMVACGRKAKDVNSIEDLDGALIGVQLGTTGDLFATGDYGDKNVKRYNKGAEAVQALKQGKIDAVIIDNEPAKEFVKAKDFLNKKCKEVWDVFENKNTKLNLPYEAMKTLGITNQPSLETLLADSLKYYEKDNGSTTVDVILSILANENINYTFDDVYEYLRKNNKKEKYKYNLITVSYLATKLEYDEMRLSDLGIEQNIVKKLFKSLSVKEKIMCIFKNRNTLKYCYGI